MVLLNHQAWRWFVIQQWITTATSLNNFAPVIISSTMGRKSRIPIQFDFSLDLGLTLQSCFMVEGGMGSGTMLYFSLSGRSGGHSRKLRLGKSVSMRKTWVPREGRENLLSTPFLAGQHLRTTCHVLDSVEASLILLRFTLLCFTDTMILTIEGLWSLYVEQVYQCHFSKTFCSLGVFASCLGNSCNIPDFFIIIFVTVTVISDCNVLKA